jgi:hypothetical protein
MRFGGPARKESVITKQHKLRLSKELGRLTQPQRFL